MQLMLTLERKREGKFWRRCQWFSEILLGCPAPIQNNPFPRQTHGYSKHCSKCAQTPGWGSQCAQRRSQTGGAVCYPAQEPPWTWVHSLRPPANWVALITGVIRLCSLQPSHRDFVHFSSDVTCIFPTSVLPCNISPTVKLLKEGKKENPPSKITSSSENHSHYLHLLANLII